MDKIDEIIEQMKDEFLKCCPDVSYVDGLLERVPQSHERYAEAKEIDRQCWIKEKCYGDFALFYPRY